MAMRPLRRCSHTGCPLLVQGGGPCPTHRAEKARALDQAKDPAVVRLYHSARWLRYRVQFLRRHQLCLHCEEAGRLEAANEVDHIVPHHGDYALFWDPANHQALCKPCHSRKTATEVLPGPRATARRAAAGRVRGEVGNFPQGGEGGGRNVALQPSGTGAGSTRVCCQNKGSGGAPLEAPPPGPLAGPTVS